MAKDDAGHVNETGKSPLNPHPNLERGLTAMTGSFISAYRENGSRATRQFYRLIEQYRDAPMSWLTHFAFSPRPCEPAENSGKTGNAAASAATSLNPLVGLEMQELMAAFAQIGKLGGEKPNLVFEQSSKLIRELALILGGTSTRMPDPKDRRFSHPQWHENPTYRWRMQAYLAWSEIFSHLVDRAENDPQQREQMRFATSLLTSALAPCNALFSNPAALHETARSGGMNLVNGTLNRVEDLICNRGLPSLMNRSVFKIGENLAATPGAVVFKTSVLELIQYRPATAEVYARPQLLVPPLISKGYVIDLAPQRSMVEYLVAHGFQVFAISWRNPTPAHRDWGLDDYAEALLGACRAACAVTDGPDLNVHGICGGTRVMIPLLGHLAAKRSRLVNAASLIVANLTTDAESAGLFASERAIAAVKRKSGLRGVLDGADIRQAYTMARPQDLVWKYWVSSYLMGNPPPAHDILHWSSDAPRIPARLHHELLDIYASNRIAEPGAVEVLGTPIALARIDCDKFVVGGMTDHISPWATSYATAQLFGGKFVFCVNSSGHAQTIVCPPGNPTLSYRVNRHHPEHADAWMATAEKRSGSWWDYWCGWLGERSGPLRKAPSVLGNAEFQPGSRAPGDYVTEP